VTFLHFAVEHRLFLIRRAAVEQVAFFHFANAVENFAAVRQFKLGQFPPEFPFYSWPQFRFAFIVLQAPGIFLGGVLI